MLEIDKHQLDYQLLTILEEQLETAARAADTAKNGATHSESSAENKYDTFGLELSYLAQGQSSRAHSLSKDILWIKSRIQTSAIQPSTDKPYIGAIVSLCHKQRIDFYYILPIAGGTSIMHNNILIRVITPHTALGAAILKADLGEHVQLSSKCIGQNPHFEITDIH
ncbi:MAG: hypothetical protein ACPG4U_05650 [Pseudomonadales bacterium]